MKPSDKTVSQFQFYTLPSRGKERKGFFDIAVFTFMGTSEHLCLITVNSTQVQEKPTLQTAKAKYLVWEAAGRSPSFSLPPESKDSKGLPLIPKV